MLERIKEFVSDNIVERFEERTTWDGGVLIAMGIIALFFTPLVKFAAYGAIAYGLWTIWKREW